MEIKHKLLNTKMTDLGLGDKFNKFFETDNPLLKDFIKGNPLLRRSYDQFRTSDSQSGKPAFNLVSTYWKSLESLLIKKGFNEKDWLMFLPRVPSRNGTRPDFSLASKEQLKKVPINHVMHVVKVGFGFSKLADFVIPEDGVYKSSKSRDLKIACKYQSDYLTIEKVLQVDRTLLPKFNSYSFKKMRPTLSLMKSTLKELGFSKKDGPFMRLPLSKKTKASYINELINVDGFPEKQAIIAVEIGIKKKWIRVD